MTNQWFSDQVDKYADLLLPHKNFLQEIRATGGSTCVLIQFLGDGYLSDQLAATTVAKLTQLGVDFGIECFVFPQSQ